MKARNAKQVRAALEVVKGGFIPADNLSRSILRQSGLVTGSVVIADIKVPRRPGYYRLAHRLAALCRDNIPEFNRATPHDVLKRLQLESGAGCEQAMVRLGDVWDTLCGELGHQLSDDELDALQSLTKGLENVPVPARVPKSLAFEEMSEAEFRAVFQGVCNHVATRYWPTLDEQQIAQMATAMPSHEA